MNTENKKINITMNYKFLKDDLLRIKAALDSDQYNEVEKIIGLSEVVNFSNPKTGIIKFNTVSGMWIFLTSDKFKIVSYKIYETNGASLTFNKITIEKEVYQEIEIKEETSTISLDKIFESWKTHKNRDKKK